MKTKSLCFIALIFIYYIINLYSVCNSKTTAEKLPKPEYKVVYISTGWTDAGTCEKIKTTINKESINGWYFKDFSFYALSSVTNSSVFIIFERFSEPSGKTGELDETKQ